jgi:hypothetical protein
MILSQDYTARGPVMQIQVLVEPVVGNGYRATAGLPLGQSAEGATAEEAVQRLRQAIEGRLSNGVRVVTLEVPAIDNPWLRIAGIFKDDPLFDEWQEAIADYRRQIDEDPD